MFPLARREFLRDLGGRVVAGGLSWQALQSLVPAQADELQITPQIVQFRPEMEEIARGWHPYCSIACWYLWRSLDGPAEM